MGARPREIGSAALTELGVLVVLKSARHTAHHQSPILCRIATGSQLLGPLVQLAILSHFRWPHIRSRMALIEHRSMSGLAHMSAARIVA